MGRLSQSANDPQQLRVYEMERAELAGHSYHVAPLKVLRRHARLLSKAYGVPTPKVYVRSEVGSSGSYDGTKILLDPDEGKNLCTLAHEMAHHIVWHWYPRAQDHGPTFMGIYADLLHMLRLVPIEGMRAICAKWRIPMVFDNNRLRIKPVAGRSAIGLLPRHPVG